MDAFMTGLVLEMDFERFFDAIDEADAVRKEKAVERQQLQEQGHDPVFYQGRDPVFGRAMTQGGSVPLLSNVQPAIGQVGIGAGGFDVGSRRSRSTFSRRIKIEDDNIYISLVVNYPLPDTIKIYEKSRGLLEIQGPSYPDEWNFSGITIFVDNSLADSWALTPIYLATGRPLAPSVFYQTSLYQYLGDAWTEVQKFTNPSFYGNAGQAQLSPTGSYCYSQIDPNTNITDRYVLFVTSVLRGINTYSTHFVGTPNAITLGVEAGSSPVFISSSGLGAGINATGWTRDVLLSNGVARVNPAAFRGNNVFFFSGNYLLSPFRLSTLFLEGNNELRFYLTANGGAEISGVITSSFLGLSNSDLFSTSGYFDFDLSGDLYLVTWFYGDNKVRLRRVAYRNNELVCVSSTTISFPAQVSTSNFLNVQIKQENFPNIAAGLA
jgi:hypothetical protein